MTKPKTYEGNKAKAAAIETISKLLYITFGIIIFHFVILASLLSRAITFLSGFCCNTVFWVMVSITVLIVLFLLLLYIS